MTTLVALLVSCLDDPREGEAVRVQDTCDLNQLSTDATNPQSSLRAYVEATDQLVQKANAAETELKDACNAIDTDLGLPTGNDAQAACNPIGARVSKIAETQAKPPAPFLPNWAELRFVAACEAPPDTLAKCLTTCAGPCDVSKCEPTKLVAVCQGECQGACLSRGENLPCTGACIGNVTMTEPSTCGGECDGVCTGPNWYGRCDGACAADFVGRCEGTCTGKCNGQDINITDAGAPPDSGTPDAATDAGADADTDAGGGGGGGGGPPPLKPPPTNAPGNCQGVCVGQCSNGSEGLCLHSPCFEFQPAGPPKLAHFSQGNCFSGTCGGVCKSAFGNSSPTTCTGQCAQQAKDCKGLCAGPCVGQTANPICTGNLACGQNAECENACQAKALLAQVCAEPTILEAYALTDPKLLEAWKKHGPRLAKAMSQVKVLRSALGFIGSRAYGDFVAIGLKGDLARACVAQGNTNVSAADAKIRAMVSADPTLPKETQ